MANHTCFFELEDDTVLYLCRSLQGRGRDTAPLRHKKVHARLVSRQGVVRVVGTTMVADVQLSTSEILLASRTVDYHPNSISVRYPLVGNVTREEALQHLIDNPPEHVKKAQHADWTSSATSDGVVGWYVGRAYLGGAYKQPAWYLQERAERTHALNTAWTKKKRVRSIK